MSRTFVLIFTSLGTILGLMGVLLGVRGLLEESMGPATDRLASRPPRVTEWRAPSTGAGDGATVQRVGFASETSTPGPIRFADEGSQKSDTDDRATVDPLRRRLAVPRRTLNLLRRAPRERLDNGPPEPPPTRQPQTFPPRKDTLASPPFQNPVAAEDDWHRTPQVITPQMAARRDRIRQVLRFYYHERPLNTQDDSPWSMMHHMLAWGVDGYIHVGGPNGRKTSVIAWLCSNGICEGERLLQLNHSRLYPRLAAGLQGHEGQLLAMFAQARVPADQQLRVNGRLYTIEDLIDSEQAYCRSPSELTFRLIGLVHYLPTESSWRNQRGETWDFPRMIDEEIRAPINGVTCGGTHRLMALNYAVRRRRRDGFPIDGVWERAQRHVAAYQQRAFRLQNRDGSLSSDFFRKRGSWGDAERKLRTTGHTLEWLIFSLPHDQLQNGRVIAAVDYLCNLLINNRYYDWGKGHLGHGLRALSLYEERLFGTRPGQRQLDVAQQPRPRMAH